MCDMKGSVCLIHPVVEMLLQQSSAQLAHHRPCLHSRSIVVVPLRGDAVAYCQHRMPARHVGHSGRHPRRLPAANRSSASTGDKDEWTPSVSQLQQREQQLWDRQQQLLDMTVQLLLKERQEAAAREARLLGELQQLRGEVQQLLLGRAAAAPLAGAPAAPSGWSSSSSSPAAATLHGTPPSQMSAGAAIAAAIQAAKDSPAASEEQQQLASWEGLFQGSPLGPNSSSSSKTVASILAAADSSDVLSPEFDQQLTSLLQPGTPTARAGAATSSADEEVSSSSSYVQGNGAAKSASSSSSSQASIVVEQVKAPKDGPPPLLQIGDDDIHWVAQLHSSLMDAGYYPSDDDVENWFFGDSTQTALLTFQECAGLPQTGLADAATWTQLLGKEVALSSTAEADAAAGAAGRAEAVAMASAITAAQSSNTQDGWPVVLEMDGGRTVHSLQVALTRVGYYCGDDEMRWWQFGEATANALKTFQACSGLPESGVCDGRTWQALLGPEATPADLSGLISEEYEDDMTSPTEGAVWLLGEQRWSDPQRVNK